MYKNLARVRIWVSKVKVTHWEQKTAESSPLTVHGKATRAL